MHLRAHALTRTCTHVCVFVCMLVHVRVIVYMRVCEKVIVCVCCVLCVVCCVLCVVCCVLCVVCCGRGRHTICTIQTKLMATIQGAVHAFMCLCVFMRENKRVRFCSAVYLFVFGSDSVCSWMIVCRIIVRRMFSSPHHSYQFLGRSKQISHW